MQENNVIINYDNSKINNYYYSDKLLYKIMKNTNEFVKRYIISKLTKKDISIEFTHSITYPNKLTFRVIENNSNVDDSDIYTIIMDAYQSVKKIIDNL